MSAEEMRRRLAEGENAIDLSLEKWRRILRRSGNDDAVRELVGRGHVYLGEASCALCETAVQKHRAQRGSGFAAHSGKCNFCPLAKLEACGNPASAYMRLRNASAHPARFREETRRFLRLLWTVKKNREQVSMQALPAGGRLAG